MLWNWKKFEMWNHSSNPNAKCSPAAVNDGYVNSNNSNNSTESKVEQSLDLTNYLKFLQNLFNKSTSDSESEDETEGGKDQDEQQLKLHSQSPSPTEIQNQNKFLSSVAADSTNSSSSNSEISTGLGSQSGKSAGELPLPHHPHHNTLGDSSNESSDSSSSTSSSSFSSDDDDASSLMPSDLTPMSDLELNNLLKKTSYPLGSDVDPMSFDLDDTTTDSDKKKQNKKKKKKSKKKNHDGNQRQNKPNSGGKGNGPKGGFGGEPGGHGVDSPGSSNSTGFDSSSNFHSGGGSQSKLCKNRVRKQSLKILRSEEAAAAAGSSSSSGEISLKDLRIDMMDSASEDVANTVSSSISSTSMGMGFSGFLGGGSSNTMDTCSVSVNNKGLVSSNHIGMNCLSTIGLPDHENHNDDDDDNDSLSDYMSMAATAAASTAQVPPLPHHAFNSSDSFFNSICNGPSSAAGGGLSSSNKSSVAIPLENSHMHQGKEQRKRKSETKDGRQEFTKHKKSLGHSKAKIIEMLNSKRRKIYVLMCKKDIPKAQRTMFNVHKEVLTTKRRLAQACTRVLRQKAIQSQKVTKESVWRAKRLTREMQAYWKQADRVERDIKRRKEKEAEEQRKLDVELMEAKRQQRKLNFLITQTELYAHFMSKKLSGNNTAAEEEESKILTQLNEEEQSDRLAKIDDYDGDGMKRKAKANVQNAFKTQLAQVQLFDIDLKPRDNPQPVVEEYQQPTLFNGILKHYQLKGMNWLINLYDQGINGILADEMGLGKTIQSIAFLAHIAERYNVWGPFLVIAPASTLHNWQQELKRFVPDFKVVPYWGNLKERKILRQYWQQSNLHTPEAHFHVVVTSYQIVMADLKYFNKIKWQYLILDEAQAIKSAASARWKMLLGFSCRNRLLLTGTPIQNTMGELWALLHFIMPSLFDSHDEFNDWFSKDIESHAENKSLMDERHLSRLHLILKPFMLRRIKKDVENELSDKIEKLIPCSLTTRQRYLYSALKKKIKTDDLLKFSGSTTTTNATFAQNATTNLMNLVMQFRKVCNHPDLFERREVRSPFHMKKILDEYPKLIFRDGILAHSIPSRRHILENKFSIFNPINIHRSLFHHETHKIAQRRFPGRIKCEDVNINSGKYCANEWSFLRFSGLSSSDMWTLYCDGFLERLKQLVKLNEEFYKIRHDRLWSHQSSNKDSSSSFLLYPELALSFPNIANSTALKSLVFISATETFYIWKDHTIICVPETLEHRVLRSKKAFPGVEDPPLVPELEHKSRKPIIRPMQSTCLPAFLYHMCPKASSEGRHLYFYDRSAVWWLEKHRQCSSIEDYNCIFYGSSSKPSPSYFLDKSVGGLRAIEMKHGWSRIVAPDKEKLVTDSGKLKVLDRLLKKLKANRHRVLIYSQMTKMIDLLEEFMWFRKWTYIRLDGSSKIAERRDMVYDFQSRSDIFVFLLSTRAGGLGINLTAADTVIFYDSDWNPTVDQQAMDRAHRLGQTKQVTVYRLICKGTIEERILQRAKEKNEIQRMVISGSNFRPDILKPKEVLSLLLDDEELEKNYRLKPIERKLTGIEEKHVDSKVYSSQRFLSKGVGSSSEGTAMFSKFDLKSENKLNPTSDELESGMLKLEQRTVEESSGGSIEGSLPPSPNLSEVSQELEVDMGDMEYQEGDSFEESLMDVNPSSSSYFDEYPREIEWNSGSVSDYDEDLNFIPKKPKIGRGTGKRGRPPSRVRVQMRELDGGQLPIRRGPGRPRLRPIGPANQGIRGRRPGRPPLSKKAETISSSLTPLTPSQRVFGMYSSPDLNLS